MKNISFVLDTALVGLFGVTMVDLMVIFTGSEHNLITVDNAIKTLFAVAALFYLIAVKIPNSIKMNKLNRESKKLENESKRMENKDYRDNHNN